VAEQSTERNVSIWYITSTKGNQFANMYDTCIGKMHGQLGADPNWPNGVCDTMDHRARYLKAGADWGRGITAREQAGHQTVRKLHWLFLALCIIFIGIIVIIVLFLSVLLNCLYPNPRVLPFSSDFIPHPTGKGGRNE